MKGFQGPCVSRRSGNFITSPRQRGGTSFAADENSPIKRGNSQACGGVMCFGWICNSIKLSKRSSIEEPEVLILL